MKKKYLWIEFALLALFLAIPPITVSRIGSQDAYFTLSALVFIQLVIAFFLDFEMHYIYKNNESFPALSFRSPLFVKLSWGAISYGALMLLFALFQLIAYLKPALAADTVKAVLPSTLGAWTRCVFLLAVGAFYEESFYRQFLPDTLRLLVLNPNKSARFNKVATVCIEFGIIALFGAAHRYLGLLGILNALLSGTVLRICKIKTRSIYTGMLIHFMYNITMYLLLLF